MNNYDYSIMDLISQIVKSSEYINVNGDLMAIKANILQEFAIDFQKAAGGVLEERPDCFKIELRLEGREEFSK